MDYLLRCSIIFVTFHIICLSFGVHGINPVAKTKADRIDRMHMLRNQPDSTYPNQPNTWPWQKERNNPFKFLPNYDNYVEDYDRVGEDVDDSFQDSFENTQDVAVDGDDEEYEGDESLFLNKRSGFSLLKGGGRGYSRSNHEDLCPFHKQNYVIRKEIRGMSLLGKELAHNVTERICNHTTTSRDYNREYNRVCHSLGRTFEHGFGTHCFQRITSRDIEYRSISTGKRGRYTESDFRDGCSCGWSTYELGPIDDYHVGKILNLCQAIKDNI